MSYFSHKFIHPSSSSSVQNPTHQEYQILNPHQIYQTYSTIDSSSSANSSIYPEINPHVINPIFESGVYHSNYPGIGVQLQQPPINFSANNGASSSSWIVTQAPPIKYSTAIQPVRTEAVALTSYEAPTNYNLIMAPNRLPATPAKIPGSQSVRCEICDIECNTVQIYEQHLAGKKHGKSLAKLYAPALQSAAVQASQSTGARSGPSDVVLPGVNLEVKNQEQSNLVCKLCNVMCTGVAALAAHLAGKKHVAKERVGGTVMNPTPVKRKKEEPAPAWCDICKISCTNSDGLSIHFVGKKHQRNLQKLMTPDYNTTGAASSAPNSQASKKEAVPEDVETRKQIVLNNGAPAAALRTCTVCNVVCNSETVFRSHLTGQKHAAMETEMRARAANSSREQATLAEQAEAASASTGLRSAYPSA